MDDREIVAAIAAGELAGLAAAYDEHAESLYGYCGWMLSEPEDAADAVEETFIIAAGRLDGLRDPHRLRPWLYAVARNECHARLGPSEVGLGEPADPPSYGRDADAERAEVRRLVRTALDGLSPGEREASELDLRHDLQGADLAAVIGVPRTQAHALASHARHELEKALGPLFVARTGRRPCAELDLLLDGWDGQLDASTRKQVSHHIEGCEGCAERSHRALGAAVRYGMAPLAELPPALREEILDLCTDTSPEALSYRREVTQRAGTFLPNGFPQAARTPRRRMIALSGVAAAVGVLVALMATGIVTVLALTGPHTPRQAAAGTASSSGAASGDAGMADATSPGASPTTSGPPSSSTPPPVAPASVPPVTAKPSPSRTTASPAPATQTPRFTYRPPTPTPTFSSTPTPTPTVTQTATDTPPPTSTATSTPPG